MTKSRDPRLQLLAERVQTVIERFKSIAEVARLTGLPVNTVSRMKEGANEPQVFAVATFAERLGVSIEWLTGQTDIETPSTKDGRIATPPVTTIRIPLLNVEAAAGVGKFVEQFEMVEEFEFPEKFLRKLGGNPRTTHCIRVKHDSDSMTPTIEPRALLMVDVSQKDWPKIRSASARRKQAPDVYVFIHGDAGVRIKRIETLEHDYRALISDNAAGYPPEIVKRDPITIIGKVIWWDNRL